VKFVFPAIFAVPILAALAVSRLRLGSSLANNVAVEGDVDPGATQKRLLGFAVMMLLLIGLILVVAKQFPFPEDNYSATLRNGLSRAGFLVLFVAILLLLQRRGIPSRLQGLASLALLLLFWLDFLSHEPNQNPSVPRTVYAPALAKNRLGLEPQPV